MKVRKWKRAAAVLLMLYVVLLSCAGCREKKNEDLQVLELEETAEPSEKAGNPESDAEEAERADQNTIYVYVCGAVKEPGVYALSKGARIYEAIAHAGGVREDAAEESINQAQTLSDGERIYVPTEEEVKQGNAGDVGMQTESGSAEGKVNINTASKEELKILSGIGDSKADSIIQYRETCGAFRSIEELMNVEGIKEGTFEKIKDRITVNAGS